MNKNKWMNTSPGTPSLLSASAPYDWKMWKQESEIASTYTDESLSLSIYIILNIFFISKRYILKILPTYISLHTNESIWESLTKLPHFSIFSYIRLSYWYIHFRSYMCVQRVCEYCRYLPVWQQCNIASVLLQIYLYQLSHFPGRSTGHCWPSV